MSFLYVTEHGCKIHFSENRFQTSKDDVILSSLPAETTDGICIMSASQPTTRCMEECLIRGIPVSYLSKGGRYFGRLISTSHVDADLQRRQCRLYDTEFSLTLARRILYAKIHNQSVILRRYSSRSAEEDSDARNEMRRMGEHSFTADAIDQATGYEGRAARIYFDALSRRIDPAFLFHGRSRRPPRDPFNCLISLGYSVLTNEICDQVEVHGLNSYFGFIHRDAEKHPTLASDLLEEWRAPLVDTLALSVLNGHELTENDFEKDNSTGGCYLTREGSKKYIGKLEQRLETETSYLSDDGSKQSFRAAMGQQISSLVKAIREENAELYHPLWIR